LTAKNISPFFNRYENLIPLTEIFCRGPRLFNI